jgi:hypothetical protein
VAISIIGAALEQKVWIRTSSPLFANLYIMLIGHPGTGKTRSIRSGRDYVRELTEFHLAPVSMTWASLVDTLVTSKRHIIRPPDDPIEYNVMYICADELGAFVHKYDNEMTAGLSAFYDNDTYEQVRRTRDVKIKIKSPLLNMIVGSTPQNLSELLPETAWGQGFMSRVIMVFSDERIVGDDFAPQVIHKSEDLASDLLQINNLMGEFHVSEDYRNAVNDWRALGEPPVPDHPKLTHYNSRRKTNLYKLSMISAIDRSNALALTKDDFNQAMGWLLEAEAYMTDVFKAGAVNADGQALDEILHSIMINDHGQGVSEQAIIRFSRDRVPVHSILRVIEILEKSGQIFCRGLNSRTGIKFYSKSHHDQEPKSPQ